MRKVIFLLCLSTKTAATAMKVRKKNLIMNKTSVLQRVHITCSIGYQAKISKTKNVTHSAYNFRYFMLHKYKKAV